MCTKDQKNLVQGKVNPLVVILTPEWIYYKLYKAIALQVGLSLQNYSRKWRPVNKS